MAAANGFVTVRPDTLYGNTYTSRAATDTIAQKFTCGGTGTQEINEIGGWLATVGTAYNFKLAIFEDDAVNGCPGAMVANAESDQLTRSDADSAVYLELYHTYTTKPQLTGGGDYWIGIIQSAPSFTKIFNTGGSSVIKITSSYSWPAESDWHTHNDSAFDLSFYAVYAAAATSQFARPSSDVAGGTFRSIHVTAPFGPRVMA